MAFETAVRNPERYLGILKILKEYEGKKLNDKGLLEIISNFYLKKEVSSGKLMIKEDSTSYGISNSVKKINSTRNSDGGFPKGYQSRFWTYVRTLSEFGFVYARYNKPLKISEMAHKLINGEIDEQEAFSIQSMKYNRKSPYRNVSNDFNFFRFILKVLLKLRENGKKLSYEQFIVSTFSKDGDVEDFISLISKEKFKDYKSTYNFLVKTEKISTKENTVTKDYPDVIRRILIISGFITVKYEGKKFIQLNENRLDYIKDLLDLNFSLSEKEKEEDFKHFEKLGKASKVFLDLAKNYRKQDVLVGEKYTNKLIEIINEYALNEFKILRIIDQIETKSCDIKEFYEIPNPLKLEFYISLLVALKYGKDFFIQPNYKADHIGKPYSHAPGNMGDIEIYSKKFYWLIEVTLIRNSKQQLNNETTSVISHLNSNDKFKNYQNKYLSFIAPYVHQRTKKFLDFSIVDLSKEASVKIKPYSIEEFVNITCKKTNFEDMENYSRNIFEEYKKKLI